MLPPRDLFVILETQPSRRIIPPCGLPMLRFFLSFAFLATPSVLAADERAPAPVTFEAHVRPLLKAHCWQCHGEEEEMKGKLDARLARSLLKGGDSGPA